VSVETEAQQLSIQYTAAKHAGRTSDLRLVHRYDQYLAVSSRHRLPPYLPSTFDDFVTVLEMRDAKIPGYVHLDFVGRMRRAPDDDKFEFEPFEHFGPGYHCALKPRLEGTLSFDSIRCLEWPHQADEWRTRQRSFGWPDDLTFERVVSSGCDLTVEKVWRSQQKDVYLSFFEFHDAETILLNAWTPRSRSCITCCVLSYARNSLGTNAPSGVE
jgi:hypothetical protein